MIITVIKIIFEINIINPKPLEKKQQQQQHQLKHKYYLNQNLT